MWQLIAGPIIGIFGSAIEKWSEHKEQELKAKERALDRDHDINVMRLESDLADKRLKLEGEQHRLVVEQKTFGDNLKSANKSLIAGQELKGWMLGLAVCIEVFCKSIRPFSTAFYQIFIAIIFGWSAYNIADTGQALFTTAEFKLIFKELIFSIIGLAETTLLWWYGIRRMSKKKGQ